MFKFQCQCPLNVNVNVNKDKASNIVTILQKSRESSEICHDFYKIYSTIAKTRDDLLIWNSTDFWMTAILERRKHGKT